MTIDIILSLSFVFASMVPAYFLGCFNFRILNYYTILFWLPILFCLIGAFIIRSGVIDNSFFIYPIKDNLEEKKLALLLTSLSFCLMIYSAWWTEVLYSFCLKKKSTLRVNWILYINNSIYGSKKFTTICLWTLTLSAVIYYIYSITPSPLYLAFVGSSATEIALRRIEITRDYGGIGYIKTLALTLPFILTYYSICEFADKKNKNRFIFVCLAMLISVITIVLNGEKAPLVFYLLGIIITVSLIKPISAKTLLSLLIIVLSVIILLYFVFFDFTQISYLFYIMVERIFIAQEAAMFYATVYFSSHDYIGISSISNIFTKLLSIEATPRASEIFMKEYLPSMLDNGGWNVNGYYAHEAYSNFGIIGVILGSIYAGIINALICIFFRGGNRNSLTVAFFIFFTISITTVLTSFNYMLFNTQLILLFIIYLILTSINKTRLR
ncbi:O-antigen polymerase [Morganella morganii]